MKFVTNLVFRGQCRDAFEHYARIFNGRITAMMPFSEAPHGAMSDEMRTSPGIMHAWLDVGDQAMMGCDVPDGRGQVMSGFSASYHGEKIDETRRVFDSLADGGQVVRAFGENFWSPGFGVLTDKFGTPWTINTNIPATRSA